MLLGGILRLIWLSSLPAGFNADEAAFGYNAYSLLQTGRDEWGTAWFALPFTNLRSFGDYKLPLYSFLVVPSIKFFGLNEFSTRLPNAVFGTMAIVAIYLLARKLGFPALLAAALLAISPWHVQLSRGAFEANLIVLFFPLAIYLFLTRRFIMSAVILAVSFYSYHTTRLLTPVLAVALMLFSRKISPKFLFVLLLISLPGLWSMLGPGSSRLADIGVFSPTDNWQGVADQRFAARNLGLPDPIARIFSNKATAVFSQVVSNYTSYFSPQFLISQGPSESTYGMLTGVGVIYLLEAIFLATFLVRLIRQPDKQATFIFILLLLSPIPAALSKGSGLAANRVAAMIPFLTLCLSLGLTHLIRSTKPVIAVVAVLYLVHVAFFIHAMVYRSPFVTASSMSYGWKEAIGRLSPLAERFTDIRVSRVFSEPHIFLAFYLRYPPAKYQKHSQLWTDFSNRGFKFLDQVDGYYLGKYRFGDIHPTDVVKHPILFVGPPSQFPPTYPEYFHVDYPTGVAAIKVAEKLP